MSMSLVPTKSTPNARLAFGGTKERVFNHDL